MSSPYLGEIRMFAGTYAPYSWHLCDGSLLAIATYDALYTLLGTTYGGDGMNTFGVPDLRGRVPVGTGTGSGQTFVIGQFAGNERVPLSVANMPSHTHSVRSDGSAANSASVTNAIPGSQPATTPPERYVTAQKTAVTLAPGSVGFGGGQNLGVDVIQPVLAVNFIIALYGIFPSQS
jgi:microcystin-dependent protein